MLPINVPSNFRIIAHRGASAYAPENTASAFKIAIDMGVKEFELDTQLSTDGIVVLCHDKTLKRYGHGPQKIEECNSNELIALDMGSWFSSLLFSEEKMLTLKKLFSIYDNKVTYHIELKGEVENLPQQVLSLIHNHNLLDFCIVTSFSFEALKSMRVLTRELRLGWLVNRIDMEICEKAKELDLFQLCPPADLITSEMVELGRTIVHEIRVWGVSEKSQIAKKQIEQILKLNCNGMTINWPDWLIH